MNYHRNDEEMMRQAKDDDSYGYSELVYSSLDFAIISDKITNLRVHIKHLKWTQ